MPVGAIEALKIFIEYLTSTSKGLSDTFDDLCARLGLDKANPNDQKEIFDFLSRFGFISFDRSQRGKESVKAHVRLNIKGEAETIISILKDLIIQKIGNEIRLGTYP